MPVALERKLKKEAKKKGIKDKDAYVYGTLRKTGWKPNREKKMETLNPRIVRLAQIDKDLESIIKFDDNDKKSNFLPAAGTAVTGAALAGGGLYAAGAMAPKSYGGAGLGWRQSIAKAGRDVGGIGEGGAGRIGRTIGKGITSAGSAWQNILSKLGKTAAEVVHSSKEKPIEFGAEILGPWQGSSGHESKIDQCEFPTGLSPAAVLRFPFPKLMAFLNQRNILQQQFSWKHQRLVELGSKLDEINA